MVGPCRSGYGTLKNPHCSMAMSAEHRSKFPARHRQWWHLHEWKILEWDDKLQTNKQRNRYRPSDCFFWNDFNQHLLKCKFFNLRPRNNDLVYRKYANRILCIDNFEWEDIKQIYVTFVQIYLQITQGFAVNTLTFKDSFSLLIFYIDLTFFNGIF